MMNDHHLKGVPWLIKLFLSKLQVWSLNILCKW